LHRLERASLALAHLILIAALLNQIAARHEFIGQTRRKPKAKQQPSLWRAFS
jgi:hypothetical protein